MRFNLKTGAVDNTGDLWWADNWIHISIPQGMISLFMPPTEVFTFCSFLNATYISKDGFFQKSDNYEYHSEGHDSFDKEVFVNVLLSNKTITALNINVNHIPNFTAYLLQMMHGVI